MALQRIPDNLRGFFRLLDELTVLFRPTINNRITLARRLMRSGRTARAHKIAASLAKTMPDDPKINRLQWLIAANDRDYATCEAKLLPLSAQGTVDTDAVYHWANILWQRGHGDAAWQAGLAAATDRPELLSQDETSRASALEKLQADLENAIEGSGPNGQFDPHMAGKKFFLRPHFIKDHQRSDAKTSRFLSQLTELEAHADFSAARVLVEAHLEDVLRRTPNPRYCADLLYRAAMVFERTNAPARSETCLERANFFCRSDPFLADRYFSSLRENNPHLKSGGNNQVGVLIVTCAKTAERARKLASAIHSQIGCLVVSVQADPRQSRTIDSTKTDFGYQISVACDDGYLALPRKLTLAFRYLAHCSDLTGVLKIDDDVIVNDFGMFEKLLLRCRSGRANYLGYVGKYRFPSYHHGPHNLASDRPAVATHAPVQFCHGGDGYYLSRKALMAIAQKTLTEFDSTGPGCVFEDVFMAEALSSAGIRPRHLNVSMTGGYTMDAFQATNLLRNLQT